MLPKDDNLILVDAHVHIYNNDRVDKSFEAAFNNFQKVSQNFGDSKKNVGILCLTERKNEKVYKNLQELAVSKGFTDRSLLVKKPIHRTKEDVSLRITSGQKDDIIIIAGHQIVSREKIEVLALGSLKIFEDGHSIDKLITDIVAKGAIPIIPWGFGKWTGKRKTILKKIIASYELPKFFVGDNGNRPKFLPKNSMFKLAKKMHIKNMPGSDHLPLASECERSGSFGFALKGSLNLSAPWKDLKNKLLGPNTVFEYFGESESPLRFLRNQLKMQWLKRFRN